MWTKIRLPHAMGYDTFDVEGCSRKEREKYVKEMKNTFFIP